MTWFWLAIVSAVLSAAAAILQKKVLHKLTAVEFSFFISILVAAFSTPLLALTEFSKVNSYSILFLFIKSMINAAAFLCIMTSLKNLELSRTLPVLASTPMFIALLAFVFLGENLSVLELTGMFMIVSGTYILELKKNENILHPFSVFKNSGYHRIIIYALLLMSVSAVMDKFILVKYKLPPMLFVVIQNYFFLLFFSAVYFFSKENTVKKFFLKRNGLILILIIIAILTIGYRLTQIESTKLAPVGMVISLKRLSVLFAVIIGAKLFKEEDYFKKIIATVLIVAGAMMIYED